MDTREVVADRPARPRRATAIVLLAVAVIASPSLSWGVIIFRPKDYQTIIKDFFSSLKFNRPASFDDGTFRYVGDCSIPSLARHQKAELSRLVIHHGLERTTLTDHEVAELKAFARKVSILEDKPLDDYRQQLDQLKKRFGLGTKRYLDGKDEAQMDLLKQVKINNDLIKAVKPTFKAHQDLERLVLRTHQVLEALSLLRHQLAEQLDCSRMRAAKGR